MLYRGGPDLRKQPLAAGPNTRGIRLDAAISLHAQLDDGMLLGLTVVGLRGDYFDFDVQSSLIANSGKTHASLLSPKLSLIFGPWSKTDDPFWDAGSYARLPYETLAGVDDPAAVANDFFRRAHAIASPSKS